MEQNANWPSFLPWFPESSDVGRLLDDVNAGFPNPSAGVHFTHIEISPIQISATMPLPISVPPARECHCKVAVKGS
jgi:hypothetical protein